MLKVKKNMHLYATTGSLTSDRAKVKAYMAKKYWIKILKKGIKPFPGCGHLWKCIANLSNSNGFRDMIFFLL